MTQFTKTVKYYVKTKKTDKLVTVSINFFCYCCLLNYLLCL